MDACSCIYVGDYDGPDFYDQRVVKARKEHKCAECGKTIEPKEEYEYVSSMYEGDFYKYKTCLDCVSVRSAFFCEGWLHHAVWEYVSDHITEMRGEIKSDCVAKLTPVARERVCELIEEQWEQEDDDEWR